MNIRYKFKVNKNINRLPLDFINLSRIDISHYQKLYPKIKFTSRYEFLDERKTVTRADKLYL